MHPTMSYFHIAEIKSKCANSICLSLLLTSDNSKALARKYLFGKEINESHKNKMDFELAFNILH